LAIGVAHDTSGYAATISALALAAKSWQSRAVKTQKFSGAHWLVKSDPETYGWVHLVKDGKTAWTGVRNFAARNHLKAMQPGDRVLFYESGGPKAVVGLAEVTRAAFPDETADEPGWVAVELKAVSPLARAVTINDVKAEPALAQMALLRLSRLSVQPVTPDEYAHVVKLGGGNV
jgi:predicted RNA-binding protein with PUA-like domain